MIRSYSNPVYTFALIGLIASNLNGCSYTQLSRSKEKPAKYAPSTDLVINEVSTAIQLVQYMDAPKKQFDVTFRVHVQNIGHAVFEGTLFIGWIDRPGHFQPSQFDHIGPFEPCTLSPGDSIDLTESWSYPLHQSATPVKLILLTDSRSISQNDAPAYHCGAFPVQEERYDNNEWYVVVRPDTVKDE